MMKKITLPEIFRAINAAETKEEKLKTLNVYYSVSVAACLSMIFNPAIKFNLPEGIPEDFKFNNTPSMSLEKAIRSFPAFVSGKGIKLELAWLRLMNSITEDEARFAFALKDKTVETGLTQSDLHEIYPSLIPAPTEDSKSKKTFQDDQKIDTEKTETVTDTTEPVEPTSDEVNDAVADAGTTEQPVIVEPENEVEDKPVTKVKAKSRKNKE